MSDPNDPWATRPESRAPEPGAEPDQPTEHLYTTDPSAAYGAVPNPTLAYPTYESLLERQAGQQLPYGRPPAPPQPSPLAPSAPARRSIALLIGMGIALGFLVAAVLAGAFLLVHPHNDDSTGALPSQDTVTQPALWPRATEPPNSRVPVLPTPFDAPAPGATYGAAIGSVTANDGTTLSVQGVLGDKTNVVHTNDQTRVLGVNRVKVSDLKIGDMVIVQGDKAADGSITARLIISTSLGN